MQCSDHPTQRLLDGRELLQDIDTVTPYLHHPWRPFNLTLLAVQARAGVDRAWSEAIRTKVVRVVDNHAMEEEARRKAWCRAWTTTSANP